MSDKKMVSILGDSYSTFAGCLPEGNYVYYPHEGIDDVAAPADTWWHQLIEKRGLELLMNDSSSGTTISLHVRPHHKVSDAFIRRMENSLSAKGVEGKKPDIIWVFGATNDSWIDNEVGQVQYENWTEDDLQRVLPAYCYLLDYVIKNNPQAQVVGIVNCDLKEEIMQGQLEACRHYGITGVMLHDIHKINGHPDKLGMQQIAQQVDEAMN